MRQPAENDADFGEEVQSPGEMQDKRNVTEPDHHRGVGATAQTSTSFNKSQAGHGDSQSALSFKNPKSKKQQEPLPWIKKLPYIKSPMKRKAT